MAFALLVIAALVAIHDSIERAAHGADGHLHEWVRGGPGPAAAMYLHCIHCQEERLDD